MAELYESSLESFRKLNRLDESEEDYSSSLNAFKSVNKITSTPEVVSESTVPSSLLTNTIIPAPEPVQTIIPEGMESALDWTTPVPETKPELLPGPKLNITPSNRHLYNFLPEDVIQENLKPAPEGFIPAVKSGTWSGLSGMLGYAADFHEAVAESPLFKAESLDMQDAYRATHSPEAFLLYKALGVNTPAKTPEDKIAAEEMDKRFRDQLRKKAQHYKDKVIDFGYKGKTTDDINWDDPSTVWDYTKHVLGSTTFPMLFAIGTGGIGSPLLMAGQLNDELNEIEGLDPGERLVLATAGGSVQGALELIGLGVITRGVPKSVLGKIGAEKMGEFLGKNFGTRVAKRFMEAGLVESGTEFGQQGFQY